MTVNFQIDLWITVDNPVETRRIYLWKVCG